MQRSLHPPGRICPYCRSRDIDTASVSGRGVICGFTINHHPWLASFPPPYVVAIVAIDEDPRVRLTTNIVGCAPEDVFVGMRVKTRFERQGDVWFPLFEPTREAESGPLPEPEPVQPFVRPMACPEKFEERSRSPASACRRWGVASWLIRSRSPSTCASRRSTTPAFVSKTSTDSPRTRAARAAPMGREASLRSRRRYAYGRRGSTGASSPPGRRARS